MQLCIWFHMPVQLVGPEAGFGRGVFASFWDQERSLGIYDLVIEDQPAWLPSRSARCNRFVVHQPVFQQSVADASVGVDGALLQLGSTDGQGEVARLPLCSPALMRDRENLHWFFAVTPFHHPGFLEEEILGREDSVSPHWVRVIEQDHYLRGPPSDVIDEAAGTLSID